MINFKQTIETFIIYSIPSIKCENEIPNINFIFDNNAFELFNYIIKHPYKYNDRWIANISKSDIDLLRIENNQNKDSKTIIIKDPILFFELLTNIINEQIKLFKEYNHHFNELSITKSLLVRIWLRMDENDFKDVISFLQKELEFYKDRTLDKYKEEKQILNDNNIISYAETSINESWDETTRSMNFRLEENDLTHTISRVLYDIRIEDNIKVCYIYGVQNNLFNITNKKIERKLYKLNKGIENPKVHPNQLYSLILFLEILKKEGIKYIKVPMNQSLNYGYHKILSENEKISFTSKWPTDLIRKIYSNNDKTSLEQRKEYELDKEWFKHIVGKEDTIRKLKTDKLFELLKRLCIYDKDFIFIGTSPYDEDILVYKLIK